jgi:hypothetical protein
MTVLNGDGLVGRVLSVTASTATVQLLLDPAAQVGVRMAGSGQLGLARGGQVVPDRRDVLGSDVLGFELLDRLAPMVDGDVVVTFGSPGGRPFVPGVPVGVLRDVAGGYGAYFGGGLGVVLLATLNAFVGGDIHRLNAMKNVLSLLVNTVALLAFVGFGPVAWETVAVGAPASLLGGIAGGRLASRLPAVALRRAVIAFSVAVGVALLVR